MGAQKMKRVAGRIRAELATLADPVHAEGAKKYFGDDFVCYGIPGAKQKVRRVLAAALRGQRDGARWPFASALAEELLRTRVYEEGQAAILALQRARRSWPDDALATFERWLAQDIDNWGICDSFCIAVVGPFLASQPARIPIVHAWAASDHRWLRRAGCVALTKLCRPLGRAAQPHLKRMIDGFIRRGEREDLLHKAMGWLLKEYASTTDQAFVEELIRSRGHALSRVTVMRATEKMPRAVRNRVRAGHARASGRGAGREALARPGGRARRPARPGVRHPV